MWNHVVLKPRKFRASLKRDVAATASRERGWICLMLYVERGFYVAWDASRGPSGGVRGAERGPELVKPDALPVAPASLGVGSEPIQRLIR